MLRREIQIGMVKPGKKSDTSEDVQVDFNERAVIVGAAVGNAIENVTKLVATYILCDTARKIIINRLSK